MVRRHFLALALVFGGGCASSSNGDGTVLATLSRPGGAKTLTIDGENLYAIVTGPDPGSDSVVKVPKSGGLPTTLYQGGTIHGYATDASSVYVAVDDRIVAVPVAGGSARVLASGTTASAIATAAGDVYWITKTSPPESVPAPGHPAIGAVVHRVSTRGGTVTDIPVEGSLDGPLSSSAALQSDSIVFASTMTRFVRVPLAGAGATTMLGHGLGDDFLGADATTIFEATDQGLLAVPTAGGAAKWIFHLSAPMTFAFALDDTSIYYYDWETHIVKLTKDGVSDRTIFADLGDRGGASSIAVDAKSVYWIGAGGIRTLPK